MDNKTYMAVDKALFEQAQEIARLNRLLKELSMAVFEGWRDLAVDNRDQFELLSKLSATLQEWQPTE